MFDPFIVSSFLHLFTILSKHFQMVNLSTSNGSITCLPCRGWCSQCVLGLALWMHTNGTFKHNCKQRPERHAQALHWISILCLCVTKKEEWPEGSLPRFNFVSQCLTPSRGRLSQGMVIWWLQDFLGPISILGSPYAMLFYYFGRNYTRFPETCLPANTAHESPQTNAIPYWNLVHQNQNSKRKSFQLVHKGHHVVAVSFVDCKGPDLERTNNCNRDAENRWPEQSDPPNVLSSCSCCGVQIISIT